MLCVATTKRDQDAMPATKPKPKRRGPSGRNRPEERLRPISKTGSKAGRPRTYHDSFPAQAARLCTLGATDVELADFFGVDIRTIWAWNSVYPEFNQSLKLGKEACNERLKRVGYQRAIGYTYESEKVFQYGGKIVRAKVREHVPPDPGVLQFFLKNRMPDEFRDRREIITEGPEDPEIARLRDAALRKLFEDLENDPHPTPIDITPKALAAPRTKEPK